MAKLTKTQKQVLRGMEDVGATKRSELLAAMMTSLVESGGGNPNYGDADSVGWRQARSHYGSVAERLKVRKSARQFGREIKGTRGQKLTPGQKAQAVQRSAFPDRYDERRAEAEALLREWKKGNYSAGRSSSRRGPGKLVTTTSKTAGVDMSGQREALKFDVLTTALSQGRMPSQSELLSLSTGLRDLKDVPGETNVDLKYKPGKKVRQRGRRGNVNAHGYAPVVREKGGHHGEIFEAFFDPAGQYYDEGTVANGAIGGHSDHVHVSASPNYVVQLGHLAQRMGLRVSENKAFDQVDPVHTQGSYHYSNRAIDVSGDSRKMAKFYARVMKQAQRQHYKPHNH